MKETPPVSQSSIAMMYEYAGIVRRSKWLIVGCIALSAALAWSYCVVAPNYYRSEALIIAEDQKLLENVVHQAGEGNFERRLFIIQRQITSRDFLGEIVTELNPYPKELEEGGEALAILALTAAVRVEKIKMDQAGNVFTGGNGIDAFTVSFMHQNPRTAMEVTKRIAEKFIAENIKEREYDAEGTLRFLDEELRRIKLELEKKEEQISAFKKSHTGELPQQTDASIRSLDRLENEIHTVNESVQRHSDRLALLEKAVQEYQLYGWQNPAFGGTASVEPDPLFHQLKELRDKLLKLKAEFKDEYPEVILTKEEIQKVEAELIASYGPEAVRPDKTPRDPYVQNLLKLQSDAKSELNLSKQRLGILYASRKDHEKRVERSPEVEQDLLVLERDYGSMKANYATLLDKRLHARVTENMEKQQKNGRFRILDQASFPRNPSIPNRPRVLVLGLLFGCVLGLGLSVMRERISPQFHGPEDVELLIGPRVLVAIPDFSFLWSLNGQRQVPYFRRQPVGGTEGSQLEVTGAKWPQGYSENGHHYEKRFVTKVFPHSMAAEQFRVAAARLQLLNTDARPKVVAVTSAVKGEGKTTAVVNLGYTLARDFGKRVLLLDCDFVFPELKNFSETESEYGLVDCFRSNIPVEEAMSSFTDIPCWIMPTGEIGPGSSELLKTGALERVLSLLREKFDYILVNAPPILPVATMNVLERHIDLVLLVVRANLTSQHDVKRALDSLRASNPIHVILNCVPMHSLPYYMTGYSVLDTRTPV